jgi:hypothetical protein
MLTPRLHYRVAPRAAPGTGAASNDNIIAPFAKELEAENARQKRILAEKELEIDAFTGGEVAFADAAVQSFTNGPDSKLPGQGPRPGRVPVCPPFSVTVPVRGDTKPIVLCPGLAVGWKRPRTGGAGEARLPGCSAWALSGRT